MTNEETVAAVRAAIRRDNAVCKSMYPNRLLHADSYLVAERRHLELLAAIKQAADRICNAMGSVEESVDAIYQRDR